MSQNKKEAWSKKITIDTEKEVKKMEKTAIEICNVFCKNKMNRMQQLWILCLLQQNIWKTGENNE